MDDPDDRQFIAEQCAATLVCVTVGSGAENFQVQVNGVSQNGVELGDWLITVERMPPSLKLC
jgi:hypothetical protein